MKPVAVPLRASRSRVEDAVALLAEHGDDAKVLAGGQSLVPMLNMRLARPSVLVDVNRLPARRASRATTAPCASARSSARRDSRGWREIPLLAEALPYVGHFVTRNRGTVGGSIAHADARRRAAARARRARRLGASVERGPDDRRPRSSSSRTSRPRSSPASCSSRRRGRPRGRGAVRLRGVRAAPRRLRALHGGVPSRRRTAHRRRVAVGAVVDRPTLLDRASSPRREPRASRPAAQIVEPWGTLHASPDVPRLLLVRVARRRVAAGAGRVIEVATVNGRRLPRVGRAAPAALRLPPPHARAHRHARRVRARRLRRLHGPARRRRRPLVPAARGAGRRREIRDRRGPAVEAS